MLSDVYGAIFHFVFILPAYESCERSVHTLPASLCPPACARPPVPARLCPPVRAAKGQGASLMPFPLMPPTTIAANVNVNGYRGAKLPALWRTYLTGVAYSVPTVAHST